MSILDEYLCDILDEYPNLKAIVIEAHPSGHLWKLGCKSGVLDQWYNRDQPWKSLSELKMSL